MKMPMKGCKPFKIIQDIANNPTLTLKQIGIKYNDTEYKFNVSLKRHKVYLVDGQWRMPVELREYVGIITKGQRVEKREYNVYRQKPYKAPAIDCMRPGAFDYKTWGSRHV